MPNDGRPAISSLLAGLGEPAAAGSPLAWACPPLPVSQGRWLVSLTRWTAANPPPCHWISLMQAEPRYSR